MAIDASATPIAFINVADRDRAIAFYRDVLGLELVSSDGFGDLFAIGAAKLRITALPDYKPGGHPALGWNVPDLGAAIDALAAKGSVFTVYPGFGQDDRGIWTSPDGGTRLAWFPDPDGNVLMLSQGS